MLFVRKLKYDVEGALLTNAAQSGEKYHLWR
jgi:hypothetical protein